MKKKKCKGTGKALNFGCGKYVIKRTYGLCNECYKNWLFNSEEGKLKINRSIIKAKKEVSKSDKSELRQQKKDIMSKSEYEKILQALINSIVRMTDIDRGCISCEHGWKTTFTRQRHAGHRYTTKAYPAIRFNLFNIFLQCSICNNYLSGNETNYDKGLKEHWGSEYIEKLEEIKVKYKELHLTIPELKEAISKATEVKKRIVKGEYLDREEINQLIGIYK
jgi:hypothetical protein